MNELQRIADRLRLFADLWLHRHGPWWLLLAGALAALLAVSVIVLPRLSAELATQLVALAELQERLASHQAPATATTTGATASAANYRAFREALADDDQVLPTVRKILDAATRHRLRATRAEYLRAADPQAQVERLQMTVPVKGRYADIRSWVEEVLRTLAPVALNELAFKREDVGLDQVEAKVRLTIWHLPPAAGEHRPRPDMDVDP
ncbi:MAG: hypothetical protein AW08_02496 [Candidatus Accumulibacter adjunctus]|uniref:Uncharacterized protein n=1 Tax=Candidatus Accumulibacter adjunctus TaxID=1454001 RepID=A0A011MVI4_9PROT|nr:MAG: hypothetical protein AW08_02496 [Candidatus Accumulibacter adjunctus]